jgi:hypothetical protein
MGAALETVKPFAQLAEPHTHRGGGMPPKAHADRNRRHGRSGTPPGSRAERRPR